MTNQRNACVWRRRLAQLLAFAGCLLLVRSAASGQGTNQQFGLFEGQADVGVTPKPGSLLSDPALDTYTLTGGGANMWGSTDAFHFVWRRWTGDVTLTAQVKILTPSGNPHRKAGLMIRQGLGPSDAFADALLHGSGLMALQYRTKQGTTTADIESQVSSPPTIRLERRGNSFMLFVAEGGQPFKQMGSAVVDLRDPVYVGLAVCSHDASALTTALFTNVEISGSATDAPMRGPFRLR